MSGDDLFTQEPRHAEQALSVESAPSPQTAPLAARMRPRDLAEYVGQRHILGAGQLLRRAIEADRIQSLIFFGPPGTGKTSLAQVIARHTRSRFVRLSGVESNVADVRRELAGAGNRLTNSGQRTILFIDEIHRFNKAQQDVLLPDVESGVVRLIGATTHNPFFFVNAPLVSRSQVFELEPLSESDLLGLLRTALTDSERGLGMLRIRADEDALCHLAKVADGDARKALNALEIGALTTPAGDDGSVHLTREVSEQSIQRKAVVYDADEDGHYDTISAFIKSMRGSDPDAALYWLAKMIHAGEDARFIARRIVICAAEDVGLADPMALVLALAAFQASEFIGWPEARIPLAEATVYVATANKSNSAYMAIDAALEDVRSGRTLTVPQHLRDASYGGAKRLGHGVGYKYAHDYPGHFVPQDYLGAARRYYQPTDQGIEKKIKERVASWRASLDQARARPAKPAPGPETAPDSSVSEHRP
ncbi:MAG: replication-associated recombination protein A [Verrucomicrobia bacterium]|jgi:putative ATPase|nr:replication-associated recombination protein A [Verrucomicrobiota bacterium]OQC67868.1 MAG: Replication-associated recombination protein A [Verrucomicrobia bacterium ADurb.Bin006]MDI9382155.1 replication-associated recombination protein A [Verrucomicrobiota bacterium]NMD22436.1 replication-associated recombination protein A [Verrucomicrobiota bacterium]HNV00261.1 replication-associated recombination protein A [Verrucomicrobiota bacterium]